MVKLNMTLEAAKKEVFLLRLRNAVIRYDFIESFYTSISVSTISELEIEYQSNEIAIKKLCKKFNLQ